jgi:hypothetical protein
MRCAPKVEFATDPPLEGNGFEPQFRDASPPPRAWLLLFGSERAALEPPQELCRFAEADDCSDDKHRAEDGSPNSN